MAQFRYGLDLGTEAQGQEAVPFDDGFELGRGMLPQLRFDFAAERRALGDPFQEILGNLLRS